MKKLNLYLISQSVNVGYDTYDSAVVAAESEDDARSIHPGGYKHTGNEWCDPKDVCVRLIGVAECRISPGVICASFNAG